MAVVVAGRIQRTKDGSDAEEKANQLLVLMPPICGTPATCSRVTQEMMASLCVCIQVITLPDDAGWE